MNINEKINKTAESNKFRNMIKMCFVGVWVISGLLFVYPMQSTDISRTQWVYGFVFGLLFMSMTKYVIGTIIEYVDNKINNTEE